MFPFSSCFQKFLLRSSCWRQKITGFCQYYIRWYSGGLSGVLLILEGVLIGIFLENEGDQSDSYLNKNHSGDQAFHRNRL